MHVSDVKKDRIYYRRPLTHSGKSIMFWHEEKLYGLVVNKVNGKKEVVFYIYNHKSMSGVKGYVELPQNAHSLKTSIRDLFEAEIVRDR